MTKILSIFMLMLFPVLMFSQEVKPNAAILIEEIISEQGIEEAQRKFEEILADTNQFILIESEFNVLGYSLIRQRKSDESIAVLKMNVKAFPNSWNVYDSLGEILAWTGKADEAIEYFEKSLELNPANENAKKNLSQIYGTKADHENETRSEFQYQSGASTGINEPYFGEQPPGLTPKLFAPGLISTHGHFEFACTFSPDGKEFYFTRRNDNRGSNVIMVCKWEESGWTAPDTAAFARPGDHEPHITPDGKKLYFGTTRVKPGADRPDYGIWEMNRNGSEWNAPEYATDGMYASATQDGSIYVTDIDGATEGGVIKRVQKDGVFEEPIRLGGGVNNPVNGIHPFISPDEVFLLFDCQREGGFGGEGDIYVAFRDNSGEWSDAINLGAEVNGPGVDFCASVSPDGKYMFYTKNRDIYWVSTKILEKQKSKNMEMDQYSYELGVVGGFSELISAGVKQLALSAPLTPVEMDRFIGDAEIIAEKHGVSVYRESDLIVSDLFPSDVATGKDVLLLYRGTTLDEYLTLKSDKTALEKEGEYDSKARIEIARRFGRMLSYSPREINRLLARNTSFRTMDDFGIQATNLFLYYEDLDKALEFYSITLGMELVSDYGMAYILKMTSDSYLILVDASKGMHRAEEPKTVALALLTDQLDEWYSYLKSRDVEMKYEYTPKEGSAHDGFVAVDPEGYLLEFERFNQHPENERFIPLLNQNKQNTLPAELDKKLPASLSIHSTITWLYHKDLLTMQNFYQDVCGLEMVADQGWTLIFKVSDTGFLAIVDEKRGMHSFTEKKAVNVGFIIDDLEGWFEYIRKNESFDLLEDELGVGPETRYKAFVGFGPEGYFLEFDHFYPHEDNTILLQYLNEE